MYFYFDIRKSYSQRHHLRRTHLTKFAEPVLKGKTTKLSDYICRFSGYVSHRLLVDYSKICTGIDFDAKAVKAFFIVAIKDLPEENGIRFYCSTSNTIDGAIISQLIDTVQLYLTIKVSAYMHRLIYQIIDDEYKWEVDYIPRLEINMTRPSMNTNGIPILHTCPEIPDDAIVITGSLTAITWKC